jgi:Nucleotide modification associated domain 2
MAKVYIYVVDRDFGFAPNPFHGYCTLATCKPQIRARAQLGDWVIGMGGARLKATGRCVFAMRITETLSFNDYWFRPEHLDKRPVRNGSNKMMVGDNIYHYDPILDQWHQADSHHSNPEGTANIYNLAKDTKANRLLVSRHFFYFGMRAPAVPGALLEEIGFRNCRSYRVFECGLCFTLLTWLHGEFRDSLNCVAADPFDFTQSDRHYSAKDNKIR